MPYLSVIFSQVLHFRFFGEGSKVVWAVSGSVWTISLKCVVEFLVKGKGRMAITMAKRLLNIIRQSFSQCSIPTLSEGGRMVSAGCLENISRVSVSV